MPRPTRPVQQQIEPVCSFAGSFHLDRLRSDIAVRSGLSQTRTGCGVPGLLVEACSGAAWPCFGRRLGSEESRWRSVGVVPSALWNGYAVVMRWFQARWISLRALDAVIWRHQDLNSLTWVWPRSFSSS